MIVATAACIFAAVCVFVAVMSLLSGPQIAGGDRVLERLEEKYMGPSAVALSAPKADMRVVMREALHSRLGSKVEKTERGSKLNRELLFADLKLHPVEWMLICGLVSVLGALAAVAKQGSILFAPVGLGLGYLGCQMFLKMRTRKRRKNFEKSLGPTVLSLSNAVKAGYTFAQAIDLVSKTAPTPMDYELQRVTRETQLGVPVTEALAHMVSRNESEDLKLLLTAVQIQSQVGGNLAQILDAIEFTIRERVRIKGEIKTITGQARASGWILIILPFALAGILDVIAPTYFGPMLSNAIGLGMLGFAAFMLACGYAIIQKIVKIEV